MKIIKVILIIAVSALTSCNEKKDFSENYQNQDFIFQKFSKKEVSKIDSLRIYKAYLKGNFDSIAKLKDLYFVPQSTFTFLNYIEYASLLNTYSTDESGKLKSDSLVKTIFGNKLSNIISTKPETVINSTDVPYFDDLNVYQADILYKYLRNYFSITSALMNEYAIKFKYENFDNEIMIKHDLKFLLAYRDITGNFYHDPYIKEADSLIKLYPENKILKEQKDFYINWKRYANERREKRLNVDHKAERWLLEQRRNNNN